MTKSLRPNLAGKAPDDLSKLRFPIMGSTKLDGIRCIMNEGRAVTRTFKDVPNRFIQEMLEGLPDGLDGELIVGEPFGYDVMNRTASGVMSEDGEPDFKYYVFDFINDEPFKARYEKAEYIIKDHHWCRMVPHIELENVDQLNAFEQQCVEQKYEGIMIRDPNAKYKFGRSTTKEGGLLKLKRFQDTEAIVYGMKELMHNANEAKLDAFGHTEHSSHKANMVPMNTLGALLCRLENGVEFDVGTGYTAAMRKQIWEDPKTIGKYAKVKFQEYTPDGEPRFPVFLGFRDPIDMD